MTRINSIILLLSLLITPLKTMAQQKQFTLEDLNFGGRHYYEMTPERRHYQWWGKQLLRLEVDKVSVIDRKNTETVLFTLDDLEAAMPKDEGIVGINLLNSTFPYGEMSCALIKTPKDRVLFDFKSRKIAWRQKHSGSLEWNKESRSDAFSKDDNLWIRLSDGTECQLTEDGSREIVYGRSVHRNEFGIEKGTFWSPDGTKLAFYRMDQTMVADYPQVNTFGRIATHEPDKYPMAGMTSHEVTVGIYDSKTKKTVFLNVGDPKDRYFTNIQWAPDGKSIYLFELNRDQNKATLDCYDAVTGEKKNTLYTETDEKYVEPLHPISFLPWDSDKFLMFSQREGYMRLYLYDTKGKMIRKVTDDTAKGIANKEYIVRDILGFNKKEKSVIVRANVSQYTSMNIVSFSVDGNEANILDGGYGVCDGQLCEDGSYIINQFSNPNVPRAYQLLGTGMKKAERRDLFVAKEPWEGYAIPHISVGNITAADGKTNLKYREVLPPDFDESKQYPTVLYVYGGPHAHLIEDSRNLAARSWEIYMAQKGYIVYVLDSRGSENRGKEFEQVTFRQLGQEEMKDQMKFVEYFSALPYVDKNRIGVHGWSYGGFMTISLMLNNPDIFKVGVAGGPVTDWKYYEVMYGERYMDTPEQNPEGYAKTSVIDKAKNLKGRLQIIIGANDPVVVPQHAMLFINACNEVGTQPDFYIYPGEEHNMQGHMSVHLHERITRYFDDFLK
ncbi:MAG: DPP IV N-terminal domain-containing protein [Prevotella sp.]|nr:DPP IV N-terminal domain-containing protein [Candidatus Prevotella equi]